MILKLDPRITHVRKANEKFEAGGVGHRGEFDGDRFQQIWGLIAQMVVADHLDVEDGIKGEGFDGGFDIIWNDIKYDVKCEIRNVAFKENEYAHNLNGNQISYDAEGLIFVSYNRNKNNYELCGYISKEDFKSKATFYPAGSKRKRSNGTELTVGAGGMYELSDKDLKRFS